MGFRNIIEEESQSTITAGQAWNASIDAENRSARVLEDFPKLGEPKHQDRLKKVKDILMKYLEMSEWELYPDGHSRNRAKLVPKPFTLLKPISKYEKLLRKVGRNKFQDMCKDLDLMTGIEYKLTSSGKGISFMVRVYLI